MIFVGDVTRRVDFKTLAPNRIFSSIKHKIRIYGRNTFTKGFTDISHIENTKHFGELS